MAPRTRNSAAASPSPAPQNAHTPPPPLPPKDDVAQTRKSGVGALLVPVAGEEAHEEVKVNNASATDMKHACDDALKRFLSRPDLFKQIYTHTDVRLALGWLSVLVAGVTGLYGWRVPFEQSKPGVWAGVILYMLLTVAQTLYAYFVEGDVVFVGKRKTFDKRIVTERITITARTTPSTPSSPPGYALGYSFVRSAAGGKALLGKARTTEERPYTAFFDERGVMDQASFERWVGETVARVMDAKAG